MKVDTIPISDSFDSLTRLFKDSSKSFVQRLPQTEGEVEEFAVPVSYKSYFSMNLNNIAFNR